VTDDWLQRGLQDCYRDCCEGLPFASVGGLDQREGALTAPPYVTSEGRDAYLEGYRLAAEKLYGVDWRLCFPFWPPAAPANDGGAV